LAGFKFIFMIKIILFDCDGPIIKRDKYFSQRILEEKGIVPDLEKQKAFFTGEFLECEIGKKDLKQVLPKWLPAWQWQGTVEELLDYWFSGEAAVDPAMKDYIISLRKNGIKCYLSTNQEKYRAAYLWNVVGLKIFLDGIFSSCYLGFMKPKIEFWQEAYKEFSNTPKDQVLVLDDTKDIVDSARAFGFNAEFYENFKSFEKVIKEKYQIII
jgi:putative hydrolase of the HAD superfamily